jgi:hypothetical protein
MWELTISLKTLTLRSERSDVRGNLHVLRMRPAHIKGPIHWDDCDIEIILNEDESFPVRDVRAGLEVRTESVAVKENCEPIFTTGEPKLRLFRLPSMMPEGA